MTGDWEYETVFLLALGIGGIVVIWILHTLLDVFVTSRIVDDPANAKFAATLGAYLLTCLIIFLVFDSRLGELIFAPGACLVGYLQYRKGLKIRKKMAEEEVSTTFA